MTLYSVHLHCRPGTRFHWGTGRRDEVGGILHADTLFGAMVENAALMAGPEATEAFIEDFEQGRILISSAFPSLEVKNEYHAHWVDFLPRPQLPGLFTYPDDVYKKIKRVRYLSPTYAHQLAKGEAITWAALQEGLCFEGGFAWHPRDGKPATLPEDAPNPFSRAEIQKVKVHTDEEEGRLHMESAVVLRGGVPGGAPHYHFWLQCESQPEAHSLLAAALRLMPDQGLGGERSTGAGLFGAISWHAAPWPEVPEANAYWHLAPSRPRNQKEWSAYLSHELLLRGGGYMSDGRRLPKIRVMAEGCVSDAPIEGSLVDLTSFIDRNNAPSHPVYRYARAFTLPMKRPVSFSASI